MATGDSGTLHYQGRGRRLEVEPSTHPTTGAATSMSTRTIAGMREWASEMVGPRDPAPDPGQTPRERVVQKDAWEDARRKNHAWDRVDGG